MLGASTFCERAISDQNILLAGVSEQSAIAVTINVGVGVMSGISTMDDSFTQTSTGTFISSGANSELDFNYTQTAVGLRARLGTSEQSAEFTKSTNSIMIGSGISTQVINLDQESVGGLLYEVVVPEGDEDWTDLSPADNETWSTISPSGDESWVDVRTRIIQDVNMASTYTANTGLEKIGSGEQAGTWGTTTNTNFDIIDGVLNGVLSLTITGNTTLTTSDGATSNGHYKVLLLGGTPSGAFNLTIDPNDQQKWFFINNNSGQTCTVLQGGGTGTTVALGTTASAIIYADGAGANANVGTVSTDVLGDTTPQLGGNLDTNGKNINFGDAATAGSDDTLQFGASQDLKIYHDGSHSYINDSGTGNLRLAGSQVDIMGGTDSGETMATFVDDGAVTLYHNNAVKIATSATGVSVTGTLAASTAVTAPSTTVTTMNATTVDLGDYTITETSSELRIAYQGTNKFKLDASGNLTVVGNITAYGSI